MSDVLAGLTGFAVVVAAGWALVRLGGLPAGSDVVLTRLCFYAATPALLLTTIARADLVAVLSRQTLAGLAAETLGVVGAGCLLRLGLRRSVAESTIGALAAGYVNAANLGIPVLIVMVGDATAIAPILLLQLLVLAPAAFAVLDWSTQRGGSRLAAWTAPLRNPLLLGVAAGLLVNLAGWEPAELLGGLLGGIVDDVLGALGSLAVTLMMLSLGMSLAASSPRVRWRLTISQVTRLRPDPAPPASATPASADPTPEDEGAGRGLVLWICVGWKLVVVPVAAAAIGLALGLRGPELIVPVTTAALPSAQNIFMFASRYGAAKTLARNCVLLTTAGFVPVVLLLTALLG